MADDGFFTCGIVPLGVAVPVFGQIQTMNQRVDQTLAATLALANELATYTISNVSFNIDPTPILNYNIRDIDDDDLDFNEVTFDDPGPIPTIGSAAFTTPALPSGEPLAPSDAPAPVITPAPDAYHPSFQPLPIINYPTVPEYSDLTSGIPFPTLRPITVPNPPAVNFDLPFLAQPPVFDAIAPDAHDFNYTEAAYNPLLITEIKTAINSMLQGTSGLPIVVEQALFARAAETVSKTADVAVQAAYEEAATKGFTLPNGMLQSKLMQISQDGQNQKGAISRDTMIRIHEVLVDQFKFGVQQGIALENLWAQLFNEIQNRRLQAAQVAVNISIAVYNARVAQYQAAGAVYETEGRVYATRINAELAKLQAYSEEIRAQQLIGELNEQDVRIYTARLQAVETNVRVYLANLQATSEKLDIEKLKLSAYQETIVIEQAKLDANKNELGFWTGQLQGQELVQQAYATRAQTYLGNVNAWRTKYEVQIDRQKGEIAAAEATTQRYLGQIQGILAKVNFETAKGQALVQDNTSRVQRFTALATANGAYNSALGEKIRALNAANAQNTELALKNGEINAQNALQIYQTLEHAIATATQVMAQITASFASSVNMNASVSDGTNFSQSCSFQTSQQVGN